MRQKSAASRALLTLLLWAGFWLIGLSLAAALLAVPAFELRYEQFGWSGALAALLGLTVLWALRPRWWFEKENQAEPLEPERYPALMQLVSDVARKVGAPPPQKVYLSIRSNAFAAIERRWLGLRRRRVVGLGLPLVATLAPDELASVLAHEYGHHVGGDLALGPWVYRTRRAIASVVDSLEDSTFFLDVPFRAYGRLFLRVSGGVSRQQELRADALAAGACGAEAAGRALQKVDVLASQWEAYFAHDVLPVLNRGARVPILDGFRRFLAAADRRPEVQRTIEELDRQPPSEADSHPPLSERLAAMGWRAGAPPLEVGGCLDLLGGEGAAEEAWLRRAVQVELQMATWDDVGEKLVVPRIQEMLAGTPLDPKILSLAAIPGLVKEGEALWMRVRPQGLDILSAEAKRAQARRLIVDALTGALAKRGYRVAVRPGRATVLQRGDEVVEPGATVERLAAGKLPEADYLAWSAEVEARPAA